MTRKKRLEGEKQTPFFLYAWLVFIGVFPFLVNIFFPKPNFDIYKDQLLKKGSLLLTGITMPNPELVWIFPKVAALVFFAIIAILYIKDNLGFNLPIALSFSYVFFALASGVFSGESMQYVLLGAPGRMDGLLYAIALSLFFVFSFLLVLQYRLSLLSMLMSVLLISSLLEGLIIVTQRLGYDYVGALTVGMRYPVITGTIGNNGMAAAMLLPSVVITTGLAAIYNNNTKRYLLLLGMSVFLALSLSLTNNRTSIFAVMLAFTLLAVLYYKNYRLYISAIVVVATLLYAPTLIPNNTSLRDRSVVNTQTVRTRLHIWKLAAKVILHTKGQPLVGGGFDALKKGIITQSRGREYLQVLRIERGWPKTVEVDEMRWLHEDGLPVETSALLVFAKDTSTGKSYSGVYKIVLDKAHNMLLDRTVSTGVLSALIWLILYLWPIYYGLRLKDVAIRLISLSVASLFVYYLLWFPVPQIEPLHVALLATAWALIYDKHAAELNNTSVE